jgi:sterol desaturase/sphingolipid hydroxylase (fatty acid hydroxylase superfamily)
LLTIILVFFLFQYGGLALVPKTDELLADVREYFGRRLELPLAEQAMEWQALAAVSVFSFFIAGLWDYLLHRFFSHSHWFWFTHENHHLPNQVFVTMPGVSARPFAVVAIFPVMVATVVSTYAALALFGWPLWDLAPLKIVLLFHAVVLTSTHSSFLRRFWWIHHVMKWMALTSPQEHVLHHSVDLKGNYGNFTTLWDRLFGTYLDPTLEKNQGHRLGLPYDQDFLGTLTLGKYKLPERVRRRFQVARYCNLTQQR